MLQNIKKIFTPDKGKKVKDKIYLGNARICELNSTATIDLTELAKHPDEFRTILKDGETHYEVDITILPFKDGQNRYGNTHYVIIRNQF